MIFCNLKQSIIFRMANIIRATNTNSHCNLIILKVWVALDELNVESKLEFEVLQYTFEH
jgi:hypothetical protein